MKPLADMTLGELLEAFEGNPQSPDVNFAIGRKLMALEKYKVAIEYFQTSIALKPKFPEAYLALAELFEKAGDIDAGQRFRLAADKLFLESEARVETQQQIPESEPEISEPPEPVSVDAATGIDEQPDIIIEIPATPPSPESGRPAAPAETLIEDSVEKDISPQYTESIPENQSAAVPEQPARSADSEPVSVKRWYYRFAGEEFGPFSIDEMRRKAESGDIHRETLVWRLGQRNWRLAADIEELHATLGVKRIIFPEYHEQQDPRPRAILHLDEPLSMDPVPAPPEPVRDEPAPEPDAERELADPGPVQEIQIPEPLVEIQTIESTPDITFDDLLPKSQKEKKSKQTRERKKRVKPKKTKPKPKPKPRERREPAPKAQTSVFRTILNTAFILAAIAGVAMIVMQGWAWRQARNAAPPPSPRIAVQAYVDAIHRHDEIAMRSALTKNSMEHSSHGASGPYAAVDFVASAAASPEMTFAILDMKQDGGQALIHGVLTAPDTPDINIEFLLFLEDNKWKIHEVNEVIDGALSL